MAQSQDSGSGEIRIGGLVDVSQQNVYLAAKGALISRGLEILDNVDNVVIHSSNIDDERILLDKEASNLLDWLAQQQGVNRELALKKALATAAYIHDVTANQGGKLLVKRKDNSLGAIVLS